MDIEDPYTAYCFDEVCQFITTKLENDEQPNWVEVDAKTGEEKEEKKMHFTRPSEFYQSIDT